MRAARELTRAGEQRSGRRCRHGGVRVAGVALRWMWCSEVAVVYGVVGDGEGEGDGGL